MYFLANLDKGSAGNTERRKNKKKESDAAIIAVSLNCGLSGADSYGLLLLNSRTAFPPPPFAPLRPPSPPFAPLRPLLAPPLLLTPRVCHNCKIQ